MIGCRIVNLQWADHSAILAESTLRRLTQAFKKYNVNAATDFSTCDGTQKPLKICGKNRQDIGGH